MAAYGLSTNSKILGMPKMATSEKVWERSWESGVLTAWDGERGGASGKDSQIAWQENRPLRR